MCFNNFFFFFFFFYSSRTPAPTGEPPRVVPMDIHSPQPPDTPQALILKPVGLKQINIKLVLNQPDIRKAEDEESSELDIIDQLINFQLEKLLVTVSLLYNGKRLEEKKYENVGVMVQAPSLGRENQLDDDRYTKVK